jgi:hypothetical protein
MKVAGARPTRSSMRPTRASRSAASPRREHVERLGHDAPDVIRGFSDSYGSWKIICTVRRKCPPLDAPRSAASRPSRRRSRPLVGRLEPNEQPAQRRLPRARLPDQAERLSRRQSRGSRRRPRARSARARRNAGGRPEQLAHAPSPRRAAPGGCRGPARRARPIDLRAVASVDPAGSGCQHAAVRPSRCGRAAGPRRRTAVARGQRGWNRHPGGGCARSGGAPPSDASGAAVRAATATTPSAPPCTGAPAGRR